MSEEAEELRRKLFGGPPSSAKLEKCKALAGLRAARLDGLPESEHPNGMPRLFVFVLRSLRGRPGNVARAFVVLAANENHARRLASMHHGDEGKEHWLDSERTGCVRLSAAVKGKEGQRSKVVLRDFYHGKTCD